MHYTAMPMPQSTNSNVACLFVCDCVHVCDMFAPVIGWEHMEVKLKQKLNKVFLFKLYQIWLFTF